MPVVGKKKDAVPLFRVSSLVELWLALIGSTCPSIKCASNHSPPRAGQKDPSPRGKFRKANCSIENNFVFLFGIKYLIKIINNIVIPLLE